jgi:eukaryotic-like serine/threonine-protein kinase
VAAPERQTKHRKIGAYRVLGELGRGGMALVYRGLHEGLQREVAIKELLPEVLADREALSRFRREAFALAAFRHQNIVTLYDLVEKNDLPFMVMEYVDGPTLQGLIREGALSSEVAAVVGARIASALDHAHFRHIIHRDLKPGNVMLTKAGEVKLMDFGIAKDAGLEALTKQGFAVGTPSYMSPEQVTGGAIDGRTDIFSLGVLLYESLSGARPFQGKTAGEVFARVRDGYYVPLPKVAPHVPRELCDIVRRAMQTKPAQRYADAAAMRRALEAFLLRTVKVSHSALLVAFLRERGKLTETEALAHLTQAELKGLANHAGIRRGLRRGLKWMATLLALGGAGTGLYATHAHWLPLVHQLLQLQR